MSRTHFAMGAPVQWERKHCLAKEEKQKNLSMLMVQKKHCTKSIMHYRVTREKYLTPDQPLMHSFTFIIYHFLILQCIDQECFDL